MHEALFGLVTYGDTYRGLLMLVIYDYWGLLMI